LHEQRAFNTCITVNARQRAEEISNYNDGLQWTVKAENFVNSKINL